MLENISDLVLKAQAGDRAATEELMRDLRHPILGQVRKYLPGRRTEDLEDCVQDVLLKLTAHLPEYDHARGVKFTTWVFTFVRNHCFDQIKRRRHTVFSLHAAARDSDDAGGEWLGAEAPPEREALRAEFHAAVLSALAALPAELADIFALRELHGLEFRAIARKLRLPLGTVKSKHYRALDRLRFSLRPFRLAAAG